MEKRERFGEKAAYLQNISGEYFRYLPNISGKYIR